MIRLLVIEDHPVFISGLRSDIRGKRHDIIIAKAAENMDQAFKASPDEFDIILLDLLLPNSSDPIRNIKSLNLQFPGKPIIILTSETKAKWEIKAKKAGATAFFTKHVEIRDLINGIKTVFDEKDKEKPESKNEKSKADIWSGRLKPREKVFIDKLSKEKSYPEIATEIGLPLNLLYTIASRLRKKYNVPNNIALLNYFKKRF